MKTQMNISILKKTVTTVLVALVVTTGSYTQSGQSKTNTNDPVSTGHLEALINITSPSIRPTATATVGLECVSAELERLDELVTTQEASLKYDASAYAREDELNSAVERLEQLVAATEASLKYTAPRTDELIDVTPELERIEMVIAATEASLKYAAPVVENSNEPENYSEYISESILAEKTK